MNSANLYDFLLQAKKRNLSMVITFDDHDRYPLEKTDFCFSIGPDGKRETEPILVAFTDCLNESNKRLQAYRDGHLNTAGVYWTSVEPTAPVNMEYQSENVLSVWDDEKSYLVYQRPTET